MYLSGDEMYLLSENVSVLISQLIDNVRSNTVYNTFDVNRAP